MRYINTLREGETIRNIYLCKGKRSAQTRNGKPYDNLILQDRTGTLDGKVWDPNSSGIADYDEKDFIDYLNQYICDEQSTLIATLTDVYGEENLPKEYIGLPYFNF